jgi:methyl-accepting chemotaxis protein
MKNCRTRVIDRIESGPLLQIAGAAYLTASAISLVASGLLYLLRNSAALTGLPTPSPLLTAASSALLWLLTLGGAALVALLMRRCHICRSGPAKRITTAMEKMSKGDLGWKITLRRSDELAAVADSVSRASQSLADRMAKLQSQARELSDIEDYLHDSVEGDRGSNLYTIKALRKLKICTNRLRSDIDDFHISALLPQANDSAHGERSPTD